MKYTFSNTSIGLCITVQKPITSHLTKKHLLSLPRTPRLLAVYKRLYKLRFFVEPKYQLNYCKLLRRRFERNDYQLRRETFLGISTPIEEDELAHRLANTYAFVFNASCAKRDEIPVVNFYEDWKEAVEPRIETKILRTVLRMYYEARDQQDLQYDYRWVDYTKKFYQEAEQAYQKKKPQTSVNKLHREKKAHYLGFFMAEKSVMSLNESMGLCL